MPQLRLVLLIIGALFIVALVIFEIRRARRNRPAAKSATIEPAAADSLRNREPTLSLPEIHVRHPVGALQGVGMSDADSMVGLRLDGKYPEEDAGLDVEPPPGMFVDAETIEASAAFPAMVPLAPMTPETSLGLVNTTATSDLTSEALPATMPPAIPPAPIIDWPDESGRRIYSVRLMSSSAERFSGRALRLALAAEGFVPGPFDIFHKPAADGRVIVSASSLTKPGTFDQLAIDSQRFLGVSLFVVLPGPLSPPDAIEEMFRSGQELAARLDGALQDDHGHAVTPETIDAMRDTAARDAGP